MKKSTTSHAVQSKLTHLLILAFVLFTILPLHALTFDPNNPDHLSVNYDECTINDGYIEFIYFDIDGIDDEMAAFTIQFKNGSGNWENLWRWEDDDDYNAAGYTDWSYESTQGEGFYFRDYASHNVQRSWRKVGTIYYNELTWTNMPASLIQAGGTIEFRFNGFYDGNGSVDDETTITNHLESFDILAPPSINGVTASTDDCDFVKISWNNSTNIPTCLAGRVYVLISIDNGDTKIGERQYPDNTFEYYGASPGTENDYSVKYEYWISPSSFIHGDNSPNATGKRKTVPPVPPGLEASNDNCDDVVDLEWDWNQLSPSSFLITRTNDNKPITISGNNRSYEDNDVTPGVTYNYIIASENECGLSDNSTSISGISPVDPDKPVYLNAEIEEGVGVLLKWGTQSNVNGFEIERSQLGGGGSFFFNAEDNETSYLDESLVQCQTYEYRIRAINGCKPEGALSDSIATTKLIPELSNTFKPRALISSKGFHPNRVELSWSLENNENFINAFKIYRKVQGTSEDSTVIASLNSGSNFYVDNLVDAGVLYQYSVIAETQCETETIYSNVTSEVGFRSPFGTITGQVTYAGGVAVKDVKISANSTALIFGKSLAFDGQSKLMVSDTGKVDIANNLLLETWVDTIIYEADFHLFKKEGCWGLRYDHANSQYIYEIVHKDGEMSQVELPAFHISPDSYNHIAALATADSLKLFVNGVLRSKAAATSNDSIVDNHSPIIIGENYKGILKELRIWNVSKTNDNINRDYSRLMNGGEPGLNVYLRMNEGVGRYAYDVSRDDNTYNRNHAAFMGNPIWTSKVPSASQLGIAAYTDSLGNYLMTLPYNGIGETFVLTPSFQIHEFAPSTQAIYVGDGSFIHNNINFEDKSSFLVEGTVFYEGTNCPAKDVTLKVDGEIIPVNGEIPMTDAAGKFAIRVPIGHHFISVEKAGHTFSVGREPLSGTFDFQNDRAGIEFQDATLIKVVGRVVGGLREASHIPGMGRSKNNIGQAEIIFTAQSNCLADTILTDANTGEYTVELPPLNYVPKVNIVNNAAIDFGTLSLVNLSGTPNLMTRVDSLTQDSIQFHKQLDYIHRVDPIIIVKDRNGTDDFIGDTTYTFINTQAQDTVLINLRTSPFRWPIFSQQEDDFEYTCLIKVYEEYLNYDNDINNPQRDSVPTTDGKLRIINELSSHNAREIGLKGVNTLDTLNFLVYKFKPGAPNFQVLDQIPEYSFVRKLEINLIKSTGEAIPWLPVPPALMPMGGDLIFRGYMLGGRSNGKQFVTKGPEVVDFVLRDPPGSSSSATLATGSTRTSINSYDWNLGAKASTEDAIYAGTKISVGLGVSTETNISADITAGFSFEVSGGYKGSLKSVTSSSETWSTNNGEDQVGAGSDQYIGKSENITFGVAEHLSLVPDSLCASVECIGQSFGGFTFAKKYGLSVVPGGYSTNFIYNQAHIQNYLIPDLKLLRNAMLQSDSRYTTHLPVGSENYGKNNDDPVFGAQVSTTTPNVGEDEDASGPSYTFTGMVTLDTIEIDSVRFVNNQIKLWEKAIWQNEWEKVNIADEAIRDSLKNKELDDLLDEYVGWIAAFGTITPISGGVAVGGFTTVALNFVNPVPGSALAGYAVFGVTSATSIASVEIQGKYEEYLAKKAKIEEKFAQASPVNYSISATNSFSASMTHEMASSSTRSIEYELTASMKNEMKGKINNTGIGAKRGIELGFKSARDWSTENSSSETISYTLADGDQGDYFSVDVYPSLLGWGPIFNKRPGGATSCPHEPATVTEYYQPGTLISDATLARDKPTISSSPSILTNVPSEEAAVFTLTLGNSSEAGDPRIYNVSFKSTSNPFGAMVSVDGSSPNFSVAIAPDGAINKTISVFKGPGTVYQYDSLKFVITSPCQYASGTSDNVDIVEEAYISAHFLPTCTDVAMAKPEDQWVLNNSFNDTMPVAIVDYNINLSDLKNINVEYKPSSDPNWVILQKFHKDTSTVNEPDPLPIPTNAPSTLYNWDVSQLNDGYYDLRIASQCLFADSYSVTHSGVIDRINPHAFGSPSPADGILSPNDEISMKFNEPIDLGSLTDLNFDIRGVLNGTEGNHSTSLYFDGQDDYLEVVAGAPLQSRDFTIEFAVRRDGFGEQAVISQGTDPAESLFIGFNASNNFVFRINGTEVSSTTTYADNDWHYFAVSYNFEEEIAQLYVADSNGNGLVNAGNTTIFPDYVGSGRMRIGKNTANDDNHFNGNLHELRIWSKARSAAEFATNFSRILSGTEPGLLFNWRMDEAEGMFVEDQVRRRDATINGAQWQISPSGYAADFNGTDDYLIMETPTVNITQGMDLTLEFWFNSSQTNEATLYSNGSGEASAIDSINSWNISKDANGRIHVRHNGLDFVAVDSNYFDGQWHHFAMVLKRSSNLSAYIDGNLQNSIQALPFNQLGGSKMYLGARGYLQAGIEVIEQNFGGSLDEFRFWNTARTLEQIRRDKQNRMKGDEFAMLLYMPFEEYSQSPTGTITLTSTFNEQILDGTVINNNVESIGQTPNIKLQRPIEAIAYTYSVNEDEIIITPTTSPELIENVTLDITVKNVKDLHGNVMESPKTWIAYMDKNQVIWQDDFLEFAKNSGEELSFSSGILNQGGAAKMFTIENIPEWLTVVPIAGTIAPNSALPIEFTVDPFANIGEYFEDIQLLTDFNFPENLSLNLKVQAEAPDWTIDPSEFENSMGIIGQLVIRNIISSDVEDRLAAFHDDELRGVQRLQYVEAIDAYLVFMDLYSNDNFGDPITFKIWDASTGIVYSHIDPASIAFEANSVIGTVSSPQVFATDTEINYDISLKEGWNWVNHFLQNPDSTNLNITLESLDTHPDDEIKNLFHYSEYSDTEGWRGTLNNVGIRPENLYKLRVQNEGILSIRGELIDPTTRAINMVNGWNWIGFISLRNQSITQALGNLNAVDGDLIKGQSKFAVYDPLLGWIGSLQTLIPGKGYMYESIGDKSFVFPLAGYYRSGPPEEPIFDAKIWAVDYHQSASNMTAIIELESPCEETLISGQYAIGSFDDTEQVVGVAPIIEEREVAMNYLTTTGESGKALQLKLLDLDRLVAYDLNQHMDYSSNAHLGSAHDPLLLQVTEELCEVVQNDLSKRNHLTAYPTLFIDQLQVNYWSATEEEDAQLLLYDHFGRIILSEKIDISIGANSQLLHLRNESVVPGMYYLTLKTTDGSDSIKLIKAK